MKLQQLRAVARSTLVEVKATEALRNAMPKVFGPAMRVDGDLKVLARRVNERLDVMERTGNTAIIEIATAVLAPLARNRSAEVRKMVARLLPKNLTTKLCEDRHPAVRAAVARRVPYDALCKMCERFPNDDQLTTIKAERIDEVLEPVEELDSKAIGETVMTNVSELSKQWYMEAARKLLEDYGEFTRTPVLAERHWNPKAVARYCASLKASWGVEIDAKKLQEAVDMLLRELDDRRENQYGNSLSEIKKNLERLVESDDRGKLPIMPIVAEERTDPVKSLLENRCTNAEYLKFFESMFNVRKSTIPATIRKYRLGEGMSKETFVPMKAQLPHGVLNEVTEQALNRYVECWNAAVALAGEPLKLGWNIDPANIASVGFDLELF